MAWLMGLRSEPCYLPGIEYDYPPEAPTTRHERSKMFMTGTRIDPRLVPTRAQITSSHHHLMDFIYSALVSERVREAVERLEPGVHQFVATEVVRRDGSRPPMPYYFFNILNAVDPSCLRRGSTADPLGPDPRDVPFDRLAALFGGEFFDKFRTQPKFDVVMKGMSYVSERWLKADAPTSEVAKLLPFADLRSVTTPRISLSQLRRAIPRLKKDVMAGRHILRCDVEALVSDELKAGLENPRLTMPHFTLYAESAA